MNGNDVIQKIDQLNSEIWNNATNDPKTSLKNATEALCLADKAGYDLGKAESFLNIGRCRLFLSDLAQAEKDLNEALDLFRSDSNERSEAGEMRTLNSLGMRAHEASDYETALNFYFMALAQSDLTKNEEIRIRVLNNIGEIHRLINNIEEALSYYHKANTLASGCENQILYAVTSQNLGEIYLKIKDLDLAEEHFSRALNLAEKNNYNHIKADALLGLGRIQLILGNYSETENRIAESLSYYEKVSDKNGIAECSYRKGILYLKDLKPEKANPYINAAEAFAKKLNNEDLIRRCLRRKSQIEKALGNAGKALEYHERFYKMETNQRSERLKNRLKKITILYETEQTETEKESYRMQSLRLEKLNMEIGFINEIGKEITASLELEEIVHCTYRRLIELVDITIFGIALYSEDDRTIDFKYFINEGKRVEPFRIGLDNDGSISVWCVKNRQPAFIKKREDSKKYVAHWESRSGGKSKSAIFLPIMNREKIIGCLSIQSPLENSYTENHLEILGAISSFIGIALDNSNAHHELNKLNEIITTEKQELEKAYRKIAHMANHDPLTELPNRHLLNELLERGIKIAMREKTRIAVLYMDLDKFKPINDTLGHGTGDLVLRIIGERLCMTLRTSDTVARIGGDEFVAVLYNSDNTDGIQSAAEKIIASVGKDLVIKEKTFNLGISIGIAVFPDDGNGIDELLLKADNAMYEAKRVAGNRAVFSDRQPGNNPVS
ncbi:MAG: GGDEF domain-containing protein [Spirochaetales bacterium]|nr:GGDEF domain-containing protein [Spirochaetales bacterium]